MPTYTTEDLLLYLYNDMNELQKAAIENELQNDWALHEKFQVIKEAKNRLEKLKMHAPRRQTIEAIMQYAGRRISEIHS